MNRFVYSTAMDLEKVKEGISTLIRAGDVHELRAHYPKGSKTALGYFSNSQKIEYTVTYMSGEAEGVFMTLNPCDPALLTRANNVAGVGVYATGKRDIIRRLWFLTDLDPIRPDGVSSSAPEKLAATVKAHDVLAYLSERGWPQPIPMDSGDGYQLRYRIDLPNDEESTQLVKRCLQALAARFDDAGVKLDANAFGADCVGAVPGTLAAKGDSTSERPNRITGLMKFDSEDVRVVSKELLQALAAEAPKEEQAAYKGQKLDELVDGESGRAGAETEKRAICKNSDDDSLLPFGNERLVVGSVDEVNGSGEGEIPAYAPTREELLQLVRYWYEEFLSLRWFYFETGQTGGSEIRRKYFVRGRINRIAKAIGSEAVN
jgi:hypothetical protein